MLSHNETQLDSYNKNAPRAHGPSSITQEPLSPTGSSSAFIVRTRDRVGP